MSKRLQKSAVKSGKPKHDLRRRITELISNLHWSWDSRAQQLFASLDPSNGARTTTIR